MPGVSPSVTFHLWSPVLRSMATSVPYGGLLIGSDGMRCRLSRRRHRDAQALGAERSAV